MLKVHSEEIRFVSVWLFDFEQVFNYLIQIVFCENNRPNYTWNSTNLNLFLAETAFL